MYRPVAKIAALALATALLIPAAAKAEKRKIYTYQVNSVYSTAIRLLRVDLNYEILEKDQEGAYIIFNYVDNNSQKHRGSIELLDKGDEANKLTQAICSIPTVPSYLEMDLLDKLNVKLNTDHR